MTMMKNRNFHAVHLILGASEYARIKTETKPKVGQPSEPVAELTKFGWTILSPGKETDLSTKMLLTQTASADYEQLCRLDVLGLKDSATGDQGIVHEEFKEQLTRNPGGWYETSLPWNHPQLPNNKSGSLSRLDTLIRKLEKQEILKTYDEIFQDQIDQGPLARRRRWQGVLNSPQASCSRISRDDQHANSVRCFSTSQPQSTIT